MMTRITLLIPEMDHFYIFTVSLLDIFYLYMVFEDYIIRFVRSLMLVIIYLRNGFCVTRQLLKKKLIIVIGGPEIGFTPQN